MKIRLEYIGADEAGDHRHAQIIMRELGIEYGEAIPAPTGDCWVFHDVKPDTVPAELPEYVVILDEDELGGRKK